MIVSIIYDTSKIGERITHIQQLAIDWTIPEYSTSLSSVSNDEINAFLTQTIEIPIERRIGKTDYIVADATLTKPLFTRFTDFQLEKPYPYESTSDEFSFYLPTNPETGAKLEGNQPPGVWETLEKIDDGYVADFAFSTSDYFTPEELLARIEPFDIEVLWMPLYMGEYDTFEEYGWSGSGNSQTLSYPWGLAGYREVSDDFQSGSLARVLDNDSVQESQDIMLKNMNKLLNNHKSLAEQLLGTQYLEERSQYLTENGFNVYGAVVTGPVKELLKLKDVEEFHSFYLGDMKPWNWDN
ncbi:anti-sigma factor [Gracilibacillus massiliensis]|uniref:anti-sigma factor n=1 Tax=Gracilibacillus massiliensis TaxID=1564956 RepID=UPI00071D3B8F|nr:anti-sigma factor C-terminal domain-containing protein [Gracilibacillus massiliensis]